EPDRVARRLAELDALLAAAEPARTVVHGDFGPYNLLVRAGAPIVVVDFELARIDWRLTDLATALPRFAANRFRFSSRRAARFLAGYERRRPLGPSERALLPGVLEYLSLRRASVCWSRYAEDGRVAWLEEAAARAVLARALEAGRHPLAELAGG
ncbi:MAG TPA: phosphotransferase, partial [Candidatus Limnocylindrales bacterium]|nr:phosphotransferase [Candidatus Limnocylindrales bacterium]